jgi:crossover junction endodeoxyribonuclease RusA
MHISLTLPWPPSVNHYWGQSGNRRFIGKKGVQFRKDVIEAVFNAGVTSLDGRLCVHVNLYPPD